MSISNITFTKEAGGLGRVLPGEDHVSGLIFYVANDQIEELLPVNSYPIKSLEELKEVKGQTRFFGEDGYTIADESPTAIIAYHVNEFFRMNPGATLWVSILSKKSPDFKEIADLQDKAEGKIRQIGIHDEKSNNIKDAVDTIKTQTDALSGKYRAVSVVYSNTNKLKGMTVEEYKALEISGWDSKYVSVSIGQSGSEQMKKLQKNTYYRLEEHPLNVKITKSGDVISGVKLVSSKGIVFPEVLKSFYFGENKVFYKSITDDKKTFEIKPKDYSVFEGLNEKEIKIRFDNEYSATVNIEYNSDSKTIKKISLTFGDKIKALNTPEVFLYDGKEYSVNTVQRDTDKKIIAIDVKSEYFESFKSLNQEKVKIRFRCESKDNKKAVGCVGALAGAVSKAAVHENIGWVQRFNLGAEFSDPMLMNGDSVDQLTNTVQKELGESRFIFPLKYTGDEGTYFNDSHTAVKATNDYAYIESNRTIEKAIREVRASLLPQLNSPLTVNAEGKLAEDTRKSFENLCAKPLERMRNAGELSDFSAAVSAEAENLSKLNIVLKLVPKGTARQIEVKVGFATKLA